MAADAALLEVDRVSKSFGGLQALDGVSLTVRAGDLVGLIGPNGSGKSTLFNVISGFYRPDQGEVRLDGRPLTGLRPDAVARRGLVRTFQLARPLSSLTVYETLLVAAPSAFGGSPWRSLLSPSRAWVSDRVRQRAEELLALTGLHAVRDHLSTQLSYGQQKLLSLAAAVMAEPRVLLLDEPMAGVNPTLGQTLRRAIRALHAQGLTFLIVEHDMEFVMEMCRTVYVLDRGRVIASGTPQQVQADPAVVTAYLGGDAGD
ncbi:MAG: ABC transporter ATP-binding protein [Bacillota bacterium]